MFKKIVLDNYKSFRHIEIDLTSSEKNPLPYAFIYGENGSGKSNFIDSLMFLKESMNTIKFGNRLRNTRNISENAGPIEVGFLTIGNDSQDQLEPGTEILLKNIGENLDKLSGILGAEQSIDLNPFPSELPVLAREARTVGSDAGISVSYSFTLKGHDGVYSMKFGPDNRLIHEKLSYVIESRIKDIFEISDSKKDSDSYRSTPIDCRFSLQLFLKKEYGKTIEDIIKKYWGKHSFMSIINEEYSANNAAYMNESIGTGIADVIDYFNSFVVSCKHDTWQFGTGINNRILANLRSGSIPLDKKEELLIYEDALNSFFTRVYSDVKKVYYKTEARNGRLSYKLYFSKMIGGKIRDIEISNESTGTLGLLNIFPAFFECACGKTVFFDEIDTGIHDLLIKEVIIDLKETFKGQFVATTHNTSLLEVLDPKSIFVIQIDPMGEKRILPISRIERTQKNHNNRNRYLNGVFGGTPITGEIDFGEIVQHAEEELGERK